MDENVENLGWIKAVHEGDQPPLNKKMLWFDSVILMMRFYNFETDQWEVLKSILFYKDKIDFPEIGMSGLIYFSIADRTGYIYDPESSLDYKYVVAIGDGTPVIRDGNTWVVKEGEELIIPEVHQYVLRGRQMIVRGRLVIRGELLLI